LPQAILASIALLVTAGATLALGQGIRVVIDSGFVTGSTTDMGSSLIIFVGVIAVLVVGTCVRLYTVSWIGERVSADIRLAVFEHLIHMHPGFFQDNAPSEIQSRITTDTTLLQTVIGSSVSIALRNILMFVGGMILLVITEPRLSLIVLAAVPFVVLPIVFVGRQVRTLSRSSQDRLADVGSRASESFRHIKIVQAFNHQRQDFQGFASVVERALRIAMQRIRQRALLVGIVMSLVFGAIALLLLAGNDAVASGSTKPGELAAFIFYAFIVAGSVGAISEVWSDLQRAAGATERLVELLAARPAIEDGGESELAPWPQRSLEVEALSFSYPSRPEISVLNALSFAIAPGEMVAVVGPSGAGKSTLFDLLQRFYDPDSGCIRLGGQPIDQYKLSSLRGAFGFVPQDSVLFSGTLRENLTYGKPDVSDTALRAALEQANAIEFVDALPRGLETPVGEDGGGFSGGQRQRLAIARALIARPSILLLDEATSALDAQSEQSIRETIEALKGEMTILVIAHRLSTVRQADRILVLEAGQLIAVGPHEELVSNNDLYARFAEIQFAA